MLKIVVNSCKTYNTGAHGYPWRDGGHVGPSQSGPRGATQTARRKGHYAQKTPYTKQKQERQCCFDTPPWKVSVQVPHLLGGYESIPGEVCLTHRTRHRSQAL